MRKLTILFSIMLIASFAQAQTADTTLKEYTGKYNFPEGTMIASAEVTVEGGALFVTSSAGSASLAKISKDTFSIPTYNGMCYFKRNAEGKVSGIRIEVQDMVMEGEKENAQAWLRKKPELWIAKR